MNYYLVLLRTSRTVPGEKILYVDVSKLALNRYLYSFLKCFHLNGYTIYLPKDKKIIDYLCRDRGEFRFASWLLKEGFVKFGTPPKREKSIYISAEEISNDYFLDFFNNYYSEGTYHVPISEFPLVYSKFYEREDNSEQKVRKNSVFMAGNLDPEHYYKIGRTKIFEIISRREVADFIYGQEYFQSINSIEELVDFIKGGIDKKVILIDTSRDFSIGLDRLKNLTKKFNFYLALPGVLIPPCHNIVEAMSVNCIPILHRTYANTFRPPLQDKEIAFIYTELEELNDILKEVFELSEDTILPIQQNVRNYYQNYLSSKAVVRNIEENSFEKIYLLSEDSNLTRNKARTIEVI